MYDCIKTKTNSLSSPVVVGLRDGFIRSLTVVKKLGKTIQQTHGEIWQRLYDKLTNCILKLVWNYRKNYMDQCITNRCQMCIQRTWVIYSVVVTRQSSPSIVSRPCNELTSVWSMFPYNTVLQDYIRSEFSALCMSKFGVLGSLFLLCSTFGFTWYCFTHVLVLLLITPTNKNKH